MQGFEFICFTRSKCTENSHKGNYDKQHSFSNARPRIPFRNMRKRYSFRNQNARHCSNGTENNNAVGQIHQLHSMCIPLMRRCSMGAHTGPAGISSFHTVVTAGFTAQQRWWAVCNWVPQM